MTIVSKVLIGLVALAHLYFCYLEMFAVSYTHLTLPTKA